MRGGAGGKGVDLAEARAGLGVGRAALEDEHAHGGRGEGGGVGRRHGPPPFREKPHLGPMAASVTRGARR